jgi:hypothetical protein
MTAPLATPPAMPIAERQQGTAILASPTPAQRFSPAQLERS